MYGINTHTGKITNKAGARWNESHWRGNRTTDGEANRLN